jgi:hypothetical protein
MYLGMIAASIVQAMTAFYIILKITALLTIIICPFLGPKKKKHQGNGGISRFAVNEAGCLEYAVKTRADHHLVK